MKKNAQSKALVRISDGFVPVALLLAAILGRREITTHLYLCSGAVCLLSLFAGRALPIAFARQPNIKGVRGSVKCALLLQTIGLMLSMALWLLLDRKTPGLLPLIFAGWFLNIEHTFYEYLFAVGDTFSARMAHGLNAVLLAAGLLLSKGPGQTDHALWVTAATGIAALVCAVVALVCGEGLEGRISTDLIKAAPRAALQTALYPVISLTVIYCLRTWQLFVPFLCGLILYELCRTPFRRTRAESDPLNRALLLACLAASLLAIAATPALGLKMNIYTRNMLPYYSGAIVLASVCAFALFGNIRGRDGD